MNKFTYINKTIFCLFLIIPLCLAIVLEEFFSVFLVNDFLFVIICIFSMLFCTFITYRIVFYVLGIVYVREGYWEKELNCIKIYIGEKIYNCNDIICIKRWTSRGIFFLNISFLEIKYDNCKLKIASKPEISKKTFYETDISPILDALLAQNDDLKDLSEDSFGEYHVYKKCL